MPIEQLAFISRSMLPTRAAWQAAIERRAYRFLFDDEFDPALYGSTDPIPVPCRVLAIETRFRMRMTDAEIYLAQFPKLREPVGQRDGCLVFDWGGAMHELAAAQIACLALLERCGAVVYYPDDDALLDAAYLVEDIDFCLADLAGQAD